MNTINIAAYARHRIGTEISDRDIDRMVEITADYFPEGEMLRSIVKAHIEAADVVVLARREGRIQGFSIASLYRLQTPFCRRPLPAVYHRMLFVAPDVLRRRMGIMLGVRTLRMLMGWFWFARRFVLFCRTMSPNVVKRIRLFSVYYPRHNAAVPDEVVEFAQSLAPLLEAPEIDARLKLLNVFPEYRATDATAIWNRYLHTRHSEYDDVVLDGCYTREGERLFFTGTAQLLIGYNRPFGMLKLALR